MNGLPSPVPALTSAANPRIKEAIRLRDRRHREASGLTIVDGARELRRALEAGVEVVEAFVCEPLLAGPDARAILDSLEGGSAPVHTTGDAAFGRLAFGHRAEGIVAVVRTPAVALDRIALGPDPLVLVLEAVEKPGNLGAIVRTADGAGADAVIAAAARTDLFNPNAIRASAGTIFAMALAAGTSDEVLAWTGAQKLRVVAARVDGSRAYTDADLRGPLAIVLGAEAGGLSDVWQGTGIEVVRVPMYGVADSLNVSVTAAILTYESRRQRERHGQEGD